MAGGIKVGPFGGDGGDAFDVGAADYLVNIKIRHGQAIDAITVTYDIVGQRETSRRFGGAGGVEETITFQPGEFLTEVSGYVGRLGTLHVVRSLKFKSNIQRTYGPYGKNEGTPFSVPVVNGRIVGFSGRSGAYLDAVGISIVPTWL